jgi:hypothetical protein
MSYFKQLDILKQEWMDFDISIDQHTTSSLGKQIILDKDLENLEVAYGKRMPYIHLDHRALGVDIVQQLEHVAKVSNDVDTDISF